MMERWLPYVIKWINGKDQVMEDSPLNNVFEENDF
jgi:hypothetical protein